MIHLPETKNLNSARGQKAPSLQCGTETVDIHNVGKPEGQRLQATVVQIFVAGGCCITGKEHTEPLHKSIPSCRLAAAVCHDSRYDHLRLPSLLEMALQVCALKCSVGVLSHKLVALYSETQKWRQGIGQIF